MADDADELLRVVEDEPLEDSAFLTSDERWVDDAVVVDVAFESEVFGVDVEPLLLRDEVEDDVDELLAVV